MNNKKPTSINGSPKNLLALEARKQAISASIGIQQLTDEAMDRLTKRRMHLYLMGSKPLRKYVEELKAQQKNSGDTTKPPSIATLWRWRRDAQKGINALASSALSKCGRKPEVQDGPMRFYFDCKTNRPDWTPPYIVEKMQGIQYKEGWDNIHSYYTYERWFNRLPLSLQCRLQKGAAMRFQLYGLVIPQEDLSPNDIWQLDSKQFSTYSLDMETKKTIRPWTTSFLDHCTRLPVGYHITKGTPDRTAPLIALKKAIMQYGKPKCIRTDNGTIFKCRDFRRAVAALGIVLEFIDPHCPAQDGRIERWHRTIEDELLAEFKTTTIRKTATHAHLKFQDIYERFCDRFDDFVTLFSRVRKHSALGGDTPYDAWYAGISAERLDVDQNEVNEAIVIRRSIRVDRQGVELVKARFWDCEGFMSLRGRRVIITHPPEGPCQPIRAYRRENFLGVPVNLQDDRAMAGAIKAAYDGQKGKEDEICNVLKGLSTSEEAEKKRIKRALADPKKQPRKVKPAPPSESLGNWSEPTEEVA